MGFGAIITWGNYRNFDNDKFQADVKICGFDENDINTFKETTLSVFNKYAPIKKKYIGSIDAPLMTKNLHKEIMRWSRLRNKYLSKVKQRNLAHILTWDFHIH